MIDKSLAYLLNSSQIRLKGKQNMILPKPNQRGMTHLIGLVVFIAFFAVIGGYILLKGHAVTLPDKYSLKGYVYRNGIGEANVKVVSSIYGSNGSSIDYTTSNGHYGFYPITVGKNYRLVASKVINGQLYCGNKSILIYNPYVGDGVNINLGKSLKTSCS